MIFYRVKTYQSSNDIFFVSEIEAKKYIIQKELDYLEVVIMNISKDIGCKSFILNDKEYIDYYNELYTLINENKFHEAYEVCYKYKYLNYVEDKYLTKHNLEEEVEIKFWKKAKDIVMKVNKIRVFK